jgi:UDP-N-acetylglucosamine acyltransferase
MRPPGVLTHHDSAASDSLGRCSLPRGVFDERGATEGLRASDSLEAGPLALPNPARSGPRGVVMPNSSARIHPTAVISPEAELAEDVVVGPFVVVEGPVRVAAGCVLKPHAHLMGPMTLGRHNRVFSGVVLGESPQHLRYADEPTRLEIGDGNIFRENVTIHRGTTHTGLTRIGNNNFFMAGSHVAHDCVVGNNCLFANGALLGGHCVVDDGVFLSGNSAVHQFVRLGRLCLLSGASGTTKDIPPFIIQQHINCVVGVNVVGMRRAGLTTAEIDAVRKAYHIIWRQGLSLPNALARTEADLGQFEPVAQMIRFIRASARGINLANHVRLDAA